MVHQGVFALIPGRRRKRFKSIGKQSGTVALRPETTGKNAEPRFLNTSLSQLGLGLRYTLKSQDPLATSRNQSQTLDLRRKRKVWTLPAHPGKRRAKIKIKKRIMHSWALCLCDPVMFLLAKWVFGGLGYQGQETSLFAGTEWSFGLAAEGGKANKPVIS